METRPITKERKEKFNAEMVELFARFDLTIEVYDQPEGTFHIKDLDTKESQTGCSVQEVGDFVMSRCIKFLLKQKK